MQNFRMSHSRTYEIYVACQHTTCSPVKPINQQGNGHEEGPGRRENALGAAGSGGNHVAKREMTMLACDEAGSLKMASFSGCCHALSCFAYARMLPLEVSALLAANLSSS